jgi:integrase
MRRGELLGLRWRDVALDTARLSVRQSIVSVAYEIKFGEPKTARSRRSIALDQRTVAALRGWRKVQLEDRMLLGDDYENSGLVFSREDGRFVHPDRFTQIFDSTWTAPGSAASAFTTCATRTPRSRWRPASTPRSSARLGHATVAFTLDVYSHAVPALQEDAADRVAALLFNG